MYIAPLNTRRKASMIEYCIMYLLSTFDNKKFDEMYISTRGMQDTGPLICARKDVKPSYKTFLPNPYCLSKVADKGLSDCRHVGMSGQGS